MNALPIWALAGVLALAALVVLAGGAGCAYRNLRGNGWIREYRVG